MTIPNPETKAARCKRAVRDFIREMNKAGRIKEDINAALEQIRTDADAESIGVTVE